MTGTGAFDFRVFGSFTYRFRHTERPGQLPAEDEGRLALIIRGGEHSLRPTLISLSSDNLLLEKREFFLAENGAARVVETVEPHGTSESSDREWYADKDSKEGRAQLTNYIKSVYLAESVDRFDRFDPSDTAQQFQLLLETKNARRGFTDLESALVAIRMESLSVYMVQVVSSNFTLYRQRLR